MAKNTRSIAGGYAGIFEETIRGVSNTWLQAVVRYHCIRGGQGRARLPVLRRHKRTTGLGSVAGIRVRQSALRSRPAGQWRAMPSRSRPWAAGRFGVGSTGRLTSMGSSTEADVEVATQPQSCAPPRRWSSRRS
jgi:hypothetical protein